MSYHQPDIGEFRNRVADEVYQIPCVQRVEESQGVAVAILTDGREFVITVTERNPE